MFGAELLIGIAIMITGVFVAVVVAVILFKRKGTHGRGDHGEVPPPVDPGPPQPEQAEDVNRKD